MHSSDIEIDNEKSFPSLSSESLPERPWPWRVFDNSLVSRVVDLIDKSEVSIGVTNDNVLFVVANGLNIYVDNDEMSIMEQGSPLKNRYQLSDSELQKLHNVIRSKVRAEIRAFLDQVEETILPEVLEKLKCNSEELEIEKDDSFSNVVKYNVQFDNNFLLSIEEKLPSRKPPPDLDEERKRMFYGSLGDATELGMRRGFDSIDRDSVPIFRRGSDRESMILTVTDTRLVALRHILGDTISDPKYVVGDVRAIRNLLRILKPNYT